MCQLRSLNGIYKATNIVCKVVSQFCICFYVETSTPKYALVKFNNDGCLSVVPVSNILVTESQATVTEGVEYQIKWSKKEMYPAIVLSIGIMITHFEL